MKCYIFVATEWQNDPIETDSMGPPQWFPVMELPMERLPGADQDWLPKVLQLGERDELLKRTYYFDKDFNPIES